MKQKFTKLIVALSLPLFGYAQTIVNTNPENKKVILEEFTGINCVYCPQGHAIAKQIQDNNPGNVFLINVHQGGFATPSGNQPDFRTPFGNGIVNQSYSGGGFGYPSGTVNRHNFPGMEMTNAGTTAMGRDKWSAASNIILQEASYVNVALESEVDFQTRQMTINVEVYYTGNSPENTNKLNVVLLQNNTLGPQTGGGMGNNYVHMHRLIDMITGQWGEDITTTTAGTFVSKTYNYTIPEDLNNIPIVLGELELVAFVAEGNQEIISGNGTFPSYTNLEYENDISLVSIADIPAQCSGTVTPEITVKNFGNTEITSLEISYSINSGTPQTYTWTGNLGGLQQTTITLPEIAYTDNENTLEITLPTDENNQNNMGDLTFNKAVETDSQLTLEIRTDTYGYETTWNVRNSAGTIVANGSGYGSNQTYNIDLELPVDCYTFTINDSYGDGGGRAILKNINGDNVWVILGNSYSSSATVNFSTDGTMGLNDLTAQTLNIYPNPSNGIFNVSLEKKSTVEVFDVTGKMIHKSSANAGTNTINLTGKTGVFVVKITEEGSKNVTTKKVILK